MHGPIQCIANFASNWLNTLVGFVVRGHFLILPYLTALFFILTGLSCMIFCRALILQVI